MRQDMDRDEFRSESVDRRLRRALDKIPPEYRYIVLLREVEGLSTKEVAKITGMSTDNVKTRLHRARVMLREELAHR